MPPARLFLLFFLRYQTVRPPLPLAWPPLGHRCPVATETRGAHGGAAVEAHQVVVAPAVGALVPTTSAWGRAAARAHAPAAAAPAATHVLRWCSLRRATAATGIPRETRWGGGRARERGAGEVRATEGHGYGGRHAPPPPPPPTRVAAIRAVPRQVPRGAVRCGGGGAPRGRGGIGRSPPPWVAAGRPGAVVDGDAATCHWQWRWQRPSR